MRVKDLMSTKVRTIGEEASLGIALQTMLWNGIRHLPVVREGALFGLLTDRDILAHQREAGAVDGLRDSVAQAMKTEPETIGPEVTITDAAHEMIARQVDCLPVVTAGELVGVLTLTDLLAARGREAIAAEKTAQRTVDTVMTETPRAVRSDERVSDAVKVMRKLGVRHLPVIDEEWKPVGIVSDRDCRALLGPASVLRGEPLDAAGRTQVGQVMTPNPITVTHDATLKEAMQLLLDERVGALIVTGGDGKLAGMLSYLDLIAFFLGHS